MCAAAIDPVRRALIVESNALYRDRLHEMLLELGWSVDTAWNGVIGREKAQRHDYELVFCSLSLPQNDEAMTIGCIRGQQPFARILALPEAAAMPDDPALAAAYDRGADGVLNKPFGIYDLGKAISAPPIQPADLEIRTIASLDPARTDAPVLEWADP